LRLPIITPKSPPTLISRYDDAMAERLQKIMARAGIASRRKAEELIARDRVRVNGVILKRLAQAIL
jgi:23S rRNA pseudouridine2605 synthase